MPTVTIVVSGKASGVEKYAAAELQTYLGRLYQINAALQHLSAVRLDGPTVVIGHPQNHPSLADMEWPALSADGFCLKTVRTDLAGKRQSGIRDGGHDVATDGEVIFVSTGNSVGLRAMAE